MPVILITDFFVFMLLAILAWYLRVVLSKPYLRARWRKAFAQPLRVIAFMLLVLFLIVGFLDCLHYQSVANNDVKSVLDWLLLPNSEQMETSYSAPFATELFTQQMIKTNDEVITWFKPKLIYVSEDAILPKVLKGLLYGCAFFSLIFALLSKFKMPASTVKRSAWYSLTVLSLLIAVIAQLMPEYHIFGTDKIGTDVFYSSLKSIRTGLIIGTLTTLITLPFAVLFGCMAGYLGGVVDDVIQYIYTTLSSVPGVLLIAASVLVMDVFIQQHDSWFSLLEQRADLRLFMLCCVLGLTSWTSLCRILRAETLKLREQEYVMAARVMGLNTWQIIYKHIVPNLSHIILIAIVLDFSGLVLAEAVLSYVGVGVDPTMYSWGNMINAARMEMARDPIIWWSLAGAFSLMFTLVLAANIFADGVRDAFDPRAN